MTFGPSISWKIEIIYKKENSMNDYQIGYMLVFVLSVIAVFIPYIMMMAI